MLRRAGICCATGCRGKREVHSHARRDVHGGWKASAARRLREPLIALIDQINRSLNRKNRNPQTPRPCGIWGFIQISQNFFWEFYKNVEKYRRLLTRQESGHIIAMETETKKDIEIYFHFADYFLFLTISLLLKYYVEGYREVSGTDRIK